jgi:pre-rRNA-processing protein TSR2
MASLPAPAQINFARAVIARLAVWPVLRVAVESSWGGPESKQKRSWMAGEVIDAFDKSASGSASDLPDETYIEEMLLQMMADEFDCEVEDLSGEEVARDIIKLWADLNNGTIEESMKFWEEKEQKLSGKKIEFTLAKKGDDTDWVEDSGSEDEEDTQGGNSMEVDDEIPTLRDVRQRQEPVVDEEGFTLVQGKGKGSRHG